MVKAILGLVLKSSLITNALTMSVETLILTSTGTVSAVTLLNMTMHGGNNLIRAKSGTMKKATA